MRERERETDRQTERMIGGDKGDITFYPHLMTFSTNFFNIMMRALSEWGTVNF